MAALILLVASALLIFPITKPSSSVFYLSCAFLLLSIAIAKWEKKRRFKEALDYLGILPHGGKSLHYLQWGAFALILACAVTFGLSFLLLQFGLLDTQAVQDKVMSLPALSLLVAIALSPIGEETFFRGFLFRKLSEWLSSAIKGGKTHDFPGMRPSKPSIFPSHPSKPSKTLPSKQALRISFKLPFQSAPLNFPFSPLSLPPLPVVCSALLSSLLFALMHLGYGSFAEIAVTFAVGLVFCAATYQSKSTIPAILAHCAYNLISLSAYFCAGGACGF
jgi:membrane protease YdiL (CAAX protease family)